MWITGLPSVRINSNWDVHHWKLSWPMPALTDHREKARLNAFFRTVRSQFLPELPEILTLEELNQRFIQYLKTYHNRIHGSTGEEPIKLYLANAEFLRPAPDNLPLHFRRKAMRRVNNDRTVKLDGKLFEAPLGLAGLSVMLRYENHDSIEVFLDEQSKGFLAPVMPVILCGQERLPDHFMTNAARPLASRVLGRNHLEAIEKDTMEQYLTHHLNMAGLKQSVFHAPTVLAIHSSSGGILLKSESYCQIGHAGGSYRYSTDGFSRACQNCCFGTDFIVFAVFHGRREIV